MFFAGYQGGRCPTGDPHLAQGVNFTLPYDVPGWPTAQQGWRFCVRCNALFYERAGGGVCPAGGSHSAQGIDTFALSYNVASAPGAQGDWHRCVKCGAMFFNGYGGGRCPAGGKHVADLYNYVLPYTMDGYIQGQPLHSFLDLVCLLDVATQRGTYENIDAGRVVEQFHQGQSGIYLLGGASRGYMRWLEVLGAGVRPSPGPTLGVSPINASQVWTTYSKRPELVVIRQGWTFPIAGSDQVRNYILEIWWLADNDREYLAIFNYARRAEYDGVSYGLVMRPFCGDIALFERMKRELIAAAIQATVSFIVSAAAWKLSMRNASPGSTRSAQDVLEELAAKTGGKLDPYAAGGGTGWKLVTVPGGTRLYGAGGPDKSTMKWGGFEEQSLAEYVPENQWSPEFAGGSGEAETPIYEYHVDIQADTLAGMSKVATEPKAGMPLPSPSKFQYYNPAGFGTPVRGRMLGYVKGKGL